MGKILCGHTLVSISISVSLYCDNVTLNINQRSSISSIPMGPDYYGLAGLISQLTLSSGSSSHNPWILPSFRDTVLFSFVPLIETNSGRDEYVEFYLFHLFLPWKITSLTSLHLIEKKDDSLCIQKLMK